MTKNEMKAVTEKWFKSYGFNKKGIEFIYEFDKFDLFVLFHKDRFDDYFWFVVGFRLKGDEATIMINGHPYQAYGMSMQLEISKNVHSFYYEQLDEPLYLKYLQELYNKYLLPYFEKGFEYLKVLVRKPNGGRNFSRKKPFSISQQARELILK